VVSFLAKGPGTRSRAPGRSGRLAPLSAADPVITTRDGSQDSPEAHSTAHRNLAAAEAPVTTAARNWRTYSALLNSPDTPRRDGLAGLNTARRWCGLAVRASWCGPVRTSNGPAAQKGPFGDAVTQSQRRPSHRPYRRLFARSVWPPMTERDLNPVWPATAIAESALPRNIKGRKSTAPRSSRRVAVRAVRNPRPRPGRGRRGRARCSDDAPTLRSAGRGGTGEQSARQWGGRESQGPRGPRRARHP